MIHLEHFAAFAELSRISATVAVAGVWQGIALAGAAALALRLVPRTTATARFVIWMAVLLGAALLPFLRLPVAAGMSAAGGAHHAVLRLGEGWSVVIAALWLAFSVFRLGQLVAQGARLRALWRGAQPVAVDSELAVLLTGVPLRRVALCVSQEVDRPSVIGFFSPRVLIPDWLYAQLSAPELFQIVLHEVEHLRRGDDWLNLLQKLSLALFPLNPALVWIERRLCSERELACDDGVLRVTLAPRVYATCLTTLAERRMLHRTAFSLSLGAIGASGSELARRVYRILNRQPGLSPVRARVVTALLAVGLAGFAAELARSPQLVSFAAPAQSLAAQSTMEPMSGLQMGRQRNVSFRSGDRPRMTLLKATMPAPPAATFAQPVARRKVHRVTQIDRQQIAPMQMATMQQPAATRPAETMVVMTTWTMATTTGVTSESGEARATMTMTEELIRDTAYPAYSGAARMTVSRSRRGQANAAIAPVHQVSPQYAAVPTDLGWLIVEL